MIRYIVLRFENLKNIMQVLFNLLLLFVCSFIHWTVIWQTYRILSIDLLIGMGQQCDSMYFAWLALSHFDLKSYYFLCWISSRKNKQKADPYMLLYEWFEIHFTIKIYFSECGYRLLVFMNQFISHLNIGYLWDCWFRRLMFTTLVSKPENCNGLSKM